MIVYAGSAVAKGTTWVQIIIRPADHRGRPDDRDGAGQIRSTSPTSWARRSPPSPVRRTRPSPTATCWRSARSTAGRPRPAINFISRCLALVLGTAGLPHVLMRFYTVPTAKEARRSVVLTIGLITGLLPVHPGARLRVRRQSSVRTASCRPAGGRELRSPAAGLRTRRRRPAGIISAVAFATIPGGGGRADHHRVGVVRPRRLHARWWAPRQAGGQRRAGQGLPDHRGGAGHSRDRPGHPGQRQKSRSWWRWRSRPRPTCRPSSIRCTGSGSTPRRPVEHVRRTDLDDRAHRVLAGGVGRKTAMIPSMDSRTSVGQPGRRVDPTGVPGRRGGHAHLRTAATRPATPRWRRSLTGVGAEGDRALISASRRWPLRHGLGTSRLLAERNAG